MTPYLITSAPHEAVLSPTAIGLESALDRIAYALLCLLIFVVPWADSVPLLSGMPLSSWIGLMAFGFLMLRVLVVQRIRTATPIHYWMWTFIAWVALSRLWTIDPNATSQRILTYLQLMVMVWLIWELGVSEKQVVGLLQGYVLGALVASGEAIFNFATGRTAAQLDALVGKNVWETNRYSIEGVNENDLGLMIAISLPMVLYLMARQKNALINLLCWMHLIAGPVAILLTASRGASVAVLTAMLMFPFVWPRFARWQQVMFLLAGAGLVICGLFLVPATSWSRLLGFGYEISQGTMTHRTSIWSAGLTVFRDHPFLGIGAGAFSSAVASLLDIAWVAHNTFLSVLVELGIVGGLLFLFFLGSMFYSVSSMPHLERLFWRTLLLTWVVGASALTWEYHKPTWLLFGLAAAHVYARRASQTAVLLMPRPVARRP